MIIEGSSVAFAYNSAPQVIRDVKVYIDGVQFQTNEDFYNFNGTTLVPMRAFFEKLGAKVSWDTETQTVVADANGRIIELAINSKTAKINGEDKVLVVEPKLINDTTYVPLRFIAESLMYEVDWDSTNKIISIIDTKTIKEQKQLKVYESSSFFKKDYIKMEIINNEMISIKGRTDLEKTNWLFKIDSIDTKSSIIKEYKEIKSNNMYEDTFTLKDKLKEGEYKISIYFKDNYDSMFWGYYWDIPLKYEDGEIFFPISPVYENNYLEFMKNSVIEPENYLNITIKNESERKQIEDLANEITKGAKSDYDKLLEINDWVAQNIYYDWDGYITGTYGRTDAYGTLEARKSVCQGYAELTNALLRAVGIPSRLVSGHALGVSALGEYWNDVNHTKANHAWNEAFVDGRWVILDTTWNSGNKYENGTFKKGTMSYRYFDPSLEAFSYTHKIIDIDKE
jgi:transglutaminase-like putative cysteine protease